MRERLIAAVLDGQKVATSSLLIEWELEGEQLPRAGERQTVIDSDGLPVAVIELVEVQVVALGEVDDRLAREEGEGFQSVAEWREAHERFWNGEVLPELGIGPREPLDDHTQIVIERFRLLPSES